MLLEPYDDHVNKPRLPWQGGLAWQSSYQLDGCMSKPSGDLEPSPDKKHLLAKPQTSEKQ